ncbi:MAG: hypothetical protein JOY71_15580 [Acetobacteraceae bacterium]|nr:hypothetical protein [Acetobacteraceae bacterium]
MRLTVIVAATGLARSLALLALCCGMFRAMALGQPGRATDNELYAAYAEVPVPGRPQS